MTMDNATRNDSRAAQVDTRLQRLLAWSPGQRDLIKTVVLLLMVADHINRTAPGSDVAVSGRARGVSAVCPGVGAEPVPAYVYPPVCD